MSIGTSRASNRRALGSLEKAQGNTKKWGGSKSATSGLGWEQYGGAIDAPYMHQFRHWQDIKIFDDRARMADTLRYKNFLFLSCPIGPHA